MGTLLEVILEDGQQLRARASPEILRLSGTLTGRCRATLHFRTDAGARLREPLHLYRVRQISTPLDEHTGTYWTAAGLGVPNGLMVFPEKARATPFCVNYQPESSAELRPDLYQSVRAHGFIRNGVVVASMVEIIPPLSIPERWEPWAAWV
ncbi:hypothetical protein [Deinococcus altitudinis]|uniref:hypothetical protein n=1 Tax=Deinococcus altitudinis TaxID=468914 RepID=UPI00389269AD